MSVVKSEEKAIRKVNINHIVNNNGVINHLNLISSLVVEAVLIFSIFIYIIGIFEGKLNMEALGQIQTTLINIGYYLFINAISVLNDLTPIFSDFGINLSQIDTTRKSLNLETLLLSSASILIAFILNYLFIIQANYQLKLKGCYLNSYYVSLINIFFNRNRKDQDAFYITQIKLLNTAQKVGEKETKEKLLNTFFNIPLNKVKEYELYSKEVHYFTLIHYIKITIEKKEAKKEKNKEEQSDDNSQIDTKPQKI